MSEDNNSSGGGFIDMVSNLKLIAQAITSLGQVIKNTFFGATSTATTATTGASGALPSQPAGYIVMTAPGGTGTVKVPYYNP